MDLNKSFTWLKENHASLRFCNSRSGEFVFITFETSSGDLLKVRAGTFEDAMKKAMNKKEKYLNLQEEDQL